MVHDKPRCDQCFWWVQVLPPNPPNRRVGEGECRAHAPTRDGSSGRPFPQTEGLHWCGEWMSEAVALDPFR
jgi:hypothetical protein